MHVRKCILEEDPFKINFSSFFDLTKLGIFPITRFDFILFVYTFYTEILHNRIGLEIQAILHLPQLCENVSRNLYAK